MTASPSAAPRILIIRLSALGDVVMASGLIPALRELFPQAHLGWLVEPAAAPLLRHNPRLDEIIVLPRDEWQALWRARRPIALLRSVIAFRSALRARRFDVAIDAQGLFKSALCAWWSGAARRVSLIGREGSRWLMTEQFFPKPDPLKPIGTEYRALARHLGAKAPYRMDLAVGDAASASATATLESHGVRGPYAVLCPYTTRPQKHWFNDRWAALAQQLVADGVTPVLVGGPSDAAQTADITANAPGLVNLVGRLKLDETAALIAGSALLIGVDTGLTHMGSALEIPTVALFGSTRPYLDARTPRTVVMYEARPCSPCRRHPTCDGRYDCMRVFEVDTVLGTARSVMQQAA